MAGKPTTPPGQAGKPEEMKLTKGQSKKFDLRTLPQTPPERVERPEHEDPEIIRGNNGQGPGNVSATAVAPRRAAKPLAAAPAPLLQFDGLDFNNWGNGHPPDTVGDVGKDYYIQSINTSLGVFRKSDGVRVAAFTLNSFMAQGSFGNLCDTNNFGDPVVLYDTFEDRWIITDFAFQLSSGSVVNPPGSFQCFAVSMNGDPVSGGWNFYSVNTQGGLGDYPKFGIWPDGLYMYASMFGYMSGGSFQGGRAYAINKAQMYAGNPTVQVVSFEIPGGDFTVLPSNARLQSGAPPVGTPNYFLSTWLYLDAVTVYKFHVDWNDVLNSTFTGPDVPSSPGTPPSQWPNQSVANAPSLGGNSLDVLQIRAMMQNQYTNIGGVESLWATHTVRRAVNGFAAPRWYQVNVTGGTVADPMLQGTTWDPDGADVMHRFIPSLAVNRQGDLALGYSTSSSTTKPALKYAGRLASDPANTFSFGEQLLVQGAGTQTGNCGGTPCTRWGDYAAMSLDPDGCTFWFTSMYYAVDGLNHQTRIGSFSYPSCAPVGGGGTISGTVTATPGGAPISGATVNLGSRTTTTNGSGVYSFSVPAGTYPSLTVSKSGFTGASTTAVAVTDGGTTTRDFSLTSSAANGCLTDTQKADFEAGVLTNVDTSISAGDVLLVKPSLDQYNIQIGGSGVGINATTWGGQTFTPSVSGLLKKADIRLFCSGCSGTPQDLTLSVRATAAGLPTGADLASATIPGFLSASSAYYSVTFASPATVTAGTMYALVIRPNGTLTGTYALSRSVNTSGQGFDVYSGGTRVQGTASGTVWSIPTNLGSSSDCAFHIYIDSGYAPNGSVVASKDANNSAGLTPIWSTISWSRSLPANTDIKFQVAGSNSATGPFNFVGPDGTAATFFTNNAGGSLARFYGKRYLQYKAFLSTGDPAATPVLNDVSLCFVNADCSAPITITPMPASVCDSSTGNTAGGPPGAASYAWAIVNGTITGGGTSQVVTYTAGSSGSVGLVLNIVESGGCQKSASVNVPIFPIPPAPTITPSGATTFCSKDGLTLTSSSASGNQWYLNGNAIDKATSNTYQPTQSGNYTVVVTANNCSSTPSAAVSVTVNQSPDTPTITPNGPVTFCTGGNVTLTSSSPSGNQWYLNGNPINNETNQTLLVSQAGSYTVKVTGAGNCSSTSAATVITINAYPAVPTITADTNATGTQDQACPEVPLTLHATSAGATSFQWYNNNDLVNGATSSTFQATGAANYYVTATANGCTTATSAAYLVQNPTPHSPFISFRNQASNVTSIAICQGSSIIIDSDSATGIQWYKDGVAIQGAGSQSYTATKAGVYTAQLNALGCHSQFGRNVTVTVDAMPTTPTITGDTNATGTQDQACPEQPLTLHASSTGAVSYQWYSDNAPIGDGTATLVMTGVGNISVTATNGTCTTPRSATYVVQNPTPHSPFISFRNQASNVTSFAICQGSSIIIDSDSATGIQWYKDGVAIPGAGHQSYTATQSGVYTAQLNALGCHSQFGRNVTLTVNPLPSTPTIEAGGPTTFCAGGSVTLTSSSASGNRWYLNGSPINAATNNTYNATASGSYTVTVTDGNGCTSAASAATVVTVNPLPSTPTINAGAPTTFCAGGSVTLTSSSASGNRWYLNGSPINGATNNTYNATASGSYTVTITDGNGCTSAASAATSVTVNPIPSTPTINAGGPTTFCAGGSVTLTSSSASGNQWYLNGAPINGATSNTYNATASGSYTVITTASGCSSPASAATSVTVNPIPSAPTINAGGPTTFCAGGSVTLTSSSASGNQWYLNGNAINGATSNTYNATAAGNYTVVVTTSGCSSPASAAKTVVLNPLPVATITAPASTHNGIAATASVPSAGAGAAYVWTISSGGQIISGAGTTSISFRGTKPGTVTLGVTVTSGAGCVATGSATVTITQKFDPNGDGVIDPSDIFYLVRYLFVNGPAPKGVAGVMSGDANNDGVVDPSDIFYVVNYLFSGGPAPASQPRTVVAESRDSIAGDLTLGEPVLRGDRYFVPVLVTSRGTVVPSAVSLRLRFSSPLPAGTVIRRSGAAASLTPLFENSSQSDRTISYLAAWPEGTALFAGGQRSAVVAELEVPLRTGRVTIDVDRELTMLGDAQGMQTATVRAGTLQVSGATIGRTPVKTRGDE